MQHTSVTMEVQSKGICCCKQNISEDLIFNSKISAKTGSLHCWYKLAAFKHIKDPIQLVLHYSAWGIIWNSCIVGISPGNTQYKCTVLPTAAERMKSSKIMFI